MNIIAAIFTGLAALTLSACSSPEECEEQTPAAPLVLPSVF